MLRAVWGWIKQVGIRSLVIYIAAVSLFGFIGLYHISSAPGGLNSAESAARDSSQSFSLIAHNPINAPHRLVGFAIHSLGFSGYGAIRIVSFIFAAIFGLAFYWLACGWFGRSIGLLGTILFVGTPLFLLAGRQASAEIMLFAPALIIAIYSWLCRTQKYRKEAWLCLIAVSGLCLYTPGLIWWLAGGLIITRDKFKILISRISPRVAGLGAALLLLLIAPLVIAIVRDWRLIQSLLLIPTHWPHILALLKNLGWMVLALFAKTPFHTDLIIGRLPVLDVIQTALLVFGAYAMWTAARNKLWALAASIGFSIVAAAINNNLSLLILGLPAIAIFAAAGLRYLYIEWRSIFPSNPIPKSLALILMLCLVTAHLIFGISYTLVAWPHSLATRDTYVIK